MWKSVHEMLLHFIVKYLDSKTRDYATLKESIYQTGEIIYAWINTREKLLDANADIWSNIFVMCTINNVTYILHTILPVNSDSL
jgi:hypothetical protein